MAGVAADRPDLGVLVVTYNSRAFIGDCLDAVQRTVLDHTVDIVIADNASTDDSVTVARSHLPHAAIIEMGRNAGFAAANNAAMRATSARHIVLLNGDAFVGPAALDTMIAFLDAHPEAGVVAPGLRNLDGSDQRTARSFPTPAAAIWGRRSPLTRWFPRNRWSQRYLAPATRSDEHPYEVDWVSGACLMVPSAVVDAVGGLDEGFFMHWEDADWCRRINDAGFSVWCVPEAVVVHAEGGSRRGWPVAQVRYFHQGAYRYYAKHHLDGPRRVFRPLAAAALGTRAVGIIARDRVLRRTRRRPNLSPVGTGE